ncbi:MAG: DUF4065 domain-containing protein [Bacteroidia bacterium]|nr:DUF4065 domain-containing protein [Bacteroidia bacterium]
MKKPHIGGEWVLKRKLAASEPFRKEVFEIWEHYYEHKDSGEEISTTELDEINIRQVYNLYREKHHIPFPEEIRQIREQYGLSAAKMSEVLDLGANSFRNYENGEIPSLANAKLIRLAKEPQNFLNFVREKKSLFSAPAFDKLTKRIETLMGKDRMDTVVEYIWNFHLEANEFTGYTRPDFRKVAHFVLFFAEKVRPLKTRMNKLMFYCDFLNFQRTGLSVSGCNYRAIPFGPVPSHFHELFGVLEAEKYISIEEEMFDHGGTGERFVAKETFDPSLFTPEERETMEQVVRIFEDIRTQKIIEMSHSEIGWVENQEKRELISYQKYAFKLNDLPPGE